MYIVSAVCVFDGVVPVSVPAHLWFRGYYIRETGVLGHLASWSRW